jgi:DNA-binding response OmpR family regulator
MRQVDTLRHLAEGVAQLQSQLLAIGVAPGMGSPPPTPTPQIPTNSETITIGPLQIGRFPYEVRLHGEPLHITPIEHSILRCLAEAGGQVISYRDIVRRTHGYTAPDAEAQTLLKSHVRNLRIKMGADMIISIRNAGYRFVIPSDDDPEV